MNQPYFKLLGYLAENGIKHQYVAELIGVEKPTFSRKINRKGADFKAKEIQIICDHFKISSDIYFLP